MAGDFLLSHEAAIRVGAFTAILAATAAAELAAPRRALTVGRGFRWPRNLSLVAIDTLCLRFLFPLLAVQTAFIARENGWGLFNQLDLPAVAAIPLTVLALDLVIYAQHRAFHAVPLLWRLHMVHHADPDIDVTTGGRFHPIEIMLSMLLKMAVTLVIGGAAVGVIVFEVLLNATTMFNHGNVALPRGVDRLLRAVVVTPDMHRVHHSVRREETNSNFGFNVPWWDRLFGTYRDQPQDGHAAMTIGLRQFQDKRRQSLGWMLVLPFIGTPGDYPRRTAALLQTSPPPPAPSEPT
jgi:sterol desaturase/sphingolipid hydroxylase (fatty acid hydroxylase superfamily)